MRRPLLTTIGVVAVLMAACTTASPADGVSSAARSTGANLASSPSPTFAVSRVPWPAYTPANGSCAASLPAGSSPMMVVTEPLPGTDATYQGKVVIAGLDAIGRARATFQPRRSDVPGIRSPALAPHIAYTVRGTAYYMDGYGTVFRLGLDHQPETVVTKFAISLGQQFASFAVSPDGCQLAGSILSPRPASGDWTLQTMVSVAGGSPTMLHTWTGPDALTLNLMLVGWDAAGPLAVVGSSLEEPIMTSITATPPAPLTYVRNPDFFGGIVVHLAGDGMPGAPAAPASCRAAMVSATGDIACYRAGDAQTWTLSVVRSTDQKEIASVSLPLVPACKHGDFMCYRPGVQIAVGPSGLVAASWDATIQMNGVSTASSAGVWSRPDGSRGNLPSFFYAQGWVDPQTIFGSQTGGGNYQSAFAHISGSSATLEGLGFTGNFVGMLS